MVDGAGQAEIRGLDIDKASKDMFEEALIFTREMKQELAEKEAEHKKYLLEQEKQVELLALKDRADSIKFTAAHIAQGIYSGRSNSFTNINPEVAAKTSVNMAFEIEEYVSKRLSEESN